MKRRLLAVVCLAALGCQGAWAAAESLSPGASSSTLPASVLTLPATASEAAPPPYTESALRRAESVFFIALPFTTLYAAVISIGVAFAIEGRGLTLDTRVVIPTVSLAVLASSYIVWQDHRAGAALP